MITKYLVIDLQITEICDSYERAQEIAQSWAEASLDILRDADDEEVRRWANMPDCGLDTGDIQIATVKWDDETDYDDSLCSLRDIENAGGCDVSIETAFDGHAANLDEARKRGLIR